jgi:hypothetical protein
MKIHGNDNVYHGVQNVHIRVMHTYIIFSLLKNDEEEEAININDNINNNKENKQMLLQFGDGKDSVKFLSTPFPIMVKARLSQRVYEERYGGSKNFEGNNPPILGMYMIHRHYSDHFHEADEIWDTTTWNIKYLH